MRFTKSISVGFLVAFLFILTALPALGAEVKVVGGTAATAKVKVVKADIEKNSGSTLNIVSMGVEGAVELVHGRAQIMVGTYSEAAVSEALTKAGLADKAAEVRKVGTFADEVSVIVNSANPVSALTKDQLKGIFTGKIENWKDVGGKDGFITVAITRLGKGVQGIFAKEVMDGEAFFKDSLTVDAFPQVISTVANTPDAIAHAPASEVAAEKTASLKVVDAPKVKLVYNIYVFGQNPDAAVSGVVSSLAKLQ